MTQLALVIDLNVCVGCHACVTSCKEWNTSGAAGPLADDQPVRQGSDRHVLQPRADLRGRRVSRTRRRCTSRSRACTARTRRACRCARPARATSAPRTASCWSTTTSASAASTARGRVRTACASSTSSSKVMKQVHAVRRPHLRRGAARGRAQARVRDGVPDQRAALRRHPRSASPRCRRRSASSGGYALMPEWGTQPGESLPAAAQDRDARSGPKTARARRQPAQDRRLAAEAGAERRRRSTT